MIDHRSIDPLQMYRRSLIRVKLGKGGGGGGGGWGCPAITCYLSLNIVIHVGVHLVFRAVSTKFTKRAGYYRDVMQESCVLWFFRSLICMQYASKCMWHDYSVSKRAFHSPEHIDAHRGEKTRRMNSLTPN